MNPAEPNSVGTLLVAGLILGAVVLAVLFTLLGICLGRLRALRTRVEDLEGAVRGLLDRQGQAETEVAPPTSPEITRKPRP